MAKKSAKKAQSSAVADKATWDEVQDNRRIKDVPSARKLYSRLVNDNVKRSAIFAEVRNAFDDRVSISIHVYGANIGGVSRHVFTPDGQTKPFISGYSNTVLPNLWDVSRAA